MLVRAIETADRNFELLSQDDRVYASRAAKELARWQASDTGSDVTPEQFLQQRAMQILTKITERTPTFSRILERRNNLARLSLLLPLLAFLAGFGLDRITDPHRVDLLSAPLLVIIGWNLLVYAALLIWACIPPTRGAWNPGAMLRAFANRNPSLPRKLPRILTHAVGAFALEWATLSSKLTGARVGQAVHVSAALLALGAVLSLYFRGLSSQYAAGWESTWLGASQVHGFLSVLFAPAVAVFPLQGFSVAEIEALEHWRAPAAMGAARWVHLYAATLFLLVVLPRMLLACLAHWQAIKLARKFPIDLEHPYFRKLGASIGAAAGRLRVLPYSFTLDEARDKGLAAVTAMLLGEQARVLLRPSIAYGDEPPEALRDIRLDDPDVTLTAVLFTLAATPEKENHGAFLDEVRRGSARGIAVLIDESGYLERGGSQTGGNARMEERRALWDQFCNLHQTSATFVNLLDPGARPLDVGAGVRLSKPP
ncbi:MAG: DUF2868 domain-containing protein [Burkholderiaceae bacterium]